MTFVDDLDAAKTLLIEAGDSGDYVVTLDPLRFRADINGDGRGEANEFVGAIIGAASGTGPADMSTMPPPRRRAGPKIKPQPNKDGTMPEIGIGFDRADAIWLAGYANVIAGQADFLLAHDFSEFLNAIGHRFFPKAGFPMQDVAAGGTAFIDPQSDSAIADVIAAIHTISWPVVEPDRLKRVLARGHEVIALSRRNWAAILTETDDNMELIPSPSQTPQLQGPDGAVTPGDGGRLARRRWSRSRRSSTASCSAALAVRERRVRPRAPISRPRPKTDMVMIMTGYGALPFIKEGPVARCRDLRRGGSRVWRQPHGLRVLVQLTAMSPFRPRARAARRDRRADAVAHPRDRQCRDGRSDIATFWFGEGDQPTPQFIRDAAVKSLGDGGTFYTQNLGTAGAARGARAVRR